MKANNDFYAILIGAILGITFVAFLTNHLSITIH